MRGPLRSAVWPVPEIDTTVTSQSSYTKSSKVVVDSKMCVASWEGWFKTALFRSFRLSQRLSFCGKRFAIPRILIFALIVPHTSLYGVCHCLIVGSEHIARWNATSNKTLTFFSANFAFRVLLCVLISKKRKAHPPTHPPPKKKKNQNQQNILIQQMTDGSSHHLSSMP